MDSWVVAPVTRWFQGKQQVPPLPPSPSHSSSLATNSDVTVTNRALEQPELSPSLDGLNLKEPAGHPTLVTNTLEHDIPAWTVQQPQQPLSSQPQDVERSNPTAVAMHELVSQVDKVENPSSRVANAIKGLFGGSSPEGLQSMRSFADSDPTFSLDHRHDHHIAVTEDHPATQPNQEQLLQQVQFQLQQLQFLQPDQQPTLQQLQLRPLQPDLPLPQQPFVETTAVITETPIAALGDQPLPDLAPHFDDPTMVQQQNPNQTKINLQTIVRAVQWMLSGIKSPESPNSEDMTSSVHTDEDQESSPQHTPQTERSTKRKKNKRRLFAPTPPLPRPTISRTRLKVFVGTWNMMGQMPNIHEGLTGFLDHRDPQELQREQQQKQKQQQQSQNDQEQQQYSNPPHPSIIGHSSSAPNLATSTPTKPSSAAPSFTSKADQSNPNHHPDSNHKSKKRRAGDLLKRLRHPGYRSGETNSSDPARSKEREYSSSPQLTVPGILKQPFLEMNAKAPYHIIAINTQECEREIREAVFLPSKTTWERHLQTALGPDYVMIKTETMAALHLAVFIWRPIEDLVSAVDSSTVATGIGGIVGNKGAVAVSVYLGSTSFLFVNAHLTAHQGNTQARNNDYKRIIHELQLNDAPKTNPRGWHFRGDMKLRRHYNYPPVGYPQKPFHNSKDDDKSNSSNHGNGATGLQPPNPNSGNNHPQQQQQQEQASPVPDSVHSGQPGTSQTGSDQQNNGHSDSNSSQGHASSSTAVDITDQFDYTFWAGDLNYRVDLSRTDAEDCLARGDLATMMARDQLTIQKAAGAVFEGFMEAPITFKPTYKFDPLMPISDNRLRRLRQKSLGRSMSMMNIYGDRSGTPPPLLGPSISSSGGGGGGGPVSPSGLYSNLKGNKSCPTLLLEANKGDVGPVAWKLKKPPSTVTNMTATSTSADGAESSAKSVLTTDSNSNCSDKDKAVLSFANILEDGVCRDPHKGMSMTRAIASVRRRRHTIMDTLNLGHHHHHQDYQQQKQQQQRNQQHKRHPSDGLLVQVLDPSGKISSGSFQDADEELSIETMHHSEYLPPFDRDQSDLELQQAFYSKCLSSSPVEDESAKQRLPTPKSPTSKSSLNLDAPLPPLPSPPLSQAASSMVPDSEKTKGSPILNLITSDAHFSLEQEREQDHQRRLKMIRYDTSSKQRVPSWTDRILWKSTGGNFYLPSEIGDDTRSSPSPLLGGGGGGGGSKVWSLLRKSRTRLSNQGPDRDSSRNSPGSPNSTREIRFFKRDHHHNHNHDDDDDGHKLTTLNTANSNGAASSNSDNNNIHQRPSLLDSLKFDFHSSSSKKRLPQHQHPHGQNESKDGWMKRNQLSVEDEDRSAVIVKEYTAHHETGLFSDHRPVTAVFAVRFDWNLTDRGVIGGAEGILQGNAAAGRTGEGKRGGSGAAAEGTNRWGPLDKVLEKMGK